MKIVGLESLKEEMQNIVKMEKVYQKGGLKIPHFIINMSKNNGQSSVADYIATVLKTHKLRKFCALDMLLEYRLDGTMKDLKQMFEDISANAVYTNDYEGVISIDVSALAEVVNEIQIDYFLKHIQDVARHATMIIFYDAELGKRVEIVKNKICTVLDYCIQIQIHSYSEQEYAKIIVQRMKDLGIEIQRENELEEILCFIVKDKNVSNIKDALAVTDNLIYCADYNSEVPKIDIGKVKKCFHVNDNSRYMGGTK